MTSHDAHEDMTGTAGPPARITYPVDDDGVVAERELPFVVGVLGDFSGEPLQPLPPLRDRRFVRIDRDNFDDVLRGMAPRLALRVDNTLTGDGSELAVEFRFRSMGDFRPGEIARQVEPLCELLSVRGDLRDLAIRAERSRALEQLLERILSGRGESGAAGEPLDGILDRIAAAASGDAPSRIRELASRLAGMVGRGELAFDKDVATTLDAVMRAIDSRISAQVTVVLRHPGFQRLQGAWRGLHHLVASGTPRVRVLNVSARELLRDFERAPGLSQSSIFKKVYENELGTPGGTPFSLLIGDYEFSRHPQDMHVLRQMSRLGAISSCPFIAAASPRFFDFEEWAEIARSRRLEPILKAMEYVQWRSLREFADSRFIALVLPRTAARAPFGPGSDRDDEDEAGFVFEEPDPGGSVPHPRGPWMNSAFVLGALLARTIRRDGLFTALLGPQGDEIQGLPDVASPAAGGGPDRIGPVEVAIAEDRCRELSRLGFLPLRQLPDGRLVFFGGRGAWKSDVRPRPEHPADAALAARLPYTLTAARFEHTIKRISWDWTDAVTDAPALEQELNRWIRRYVGDDPRGWRRRPLREAKIVLRESARERVVREGRFEIVVTIRPWLPEEIEGPTSPIGGEADRV